MIIALYCVRSACELACSRVTTNLIPACSPIDVWTIPYPIGMYVGIPLHLQEFHFLCNLIEYCHTENESNLSEYSQSSTENSNTISQCKTD